MNAVRRRKKLMAVVIAGVLAVVTACSSGSTPSSPTPAGPPLDADTLAVELRNAGLELRSPVPYLQGEIFPILHGFERGLAIPVIGNEKDDDLYLYEFVGPAEALMAATRVREDAVSYEYPVNDSGTWRGGGPYGISRDVHVFVEGRVVVVHWGASPEIADAVLRVMGDPVAGSAFRGSPYETVGRKDIQYVWAEEPVPVTGPVTEVRRINDDPNAVRTSVRFVLNGVRAPHSRACEGRAIPEVEVVGDEIRITHVARLANIEKLTFITPCEINREPREWPMIVRNLSVGSTYHVVVNGGVHGTFEAQ